MSKKTTTNRFGFGVSVTASTTVQNNADGDEDQVQAVAQDGASAGREQTDEEIYQEMRELLLQLDREEAECAALTKQIVHGTKPNLYPRELQMKIEKIKKKHIIDEGESQPSARTGKRVRVKRKKSARTSKKRNQPPIQSKLHAAPNGASRDTTPVAVAPSSIEHGVAGGREARERSTSRIAGPGTSGIAGRGTSKIARPGNSGMPGPGQSGITRPGTSGIARPGTSGIARPGTSGIARPGSSRTARTMTAETAVPSTSTIASQATTVTVSTTNASIQKEFRNPPQMASRSRSPVSQALSNIGRARPRVREASGGPVSNIAGPGTSRIASQATTVTVSTTNASIQKEFRNPPQMASRSRSPVSQALSNIEQGRPRVREASGGPVSNIAGPGTSRISRPCKTGIAGNSTTGIARPGASGIARPGTSGIARPGITVIPGNNTTGIAKPGISGIAKPGTSGIAKPGTSGITRPGTSGIARPGTSGIARQGQNAARPITQPTNSVPNYSRQQEYQATTDVGELNKRRILAIEAEYRRMMKPLPRGGAQRVLEHRLAKGPVNNQGESMADDDEDDLSDSEFPTREEGNAARSRRHGAGVATAIAAPVPPGDTASRAAPPRARGQFGFRRPAGGGVATSTAIAIPVNLTAVRATIADLGAAQQRRRSPPAGPSLPLRSPRGTGSPSLASPPARQPTPPARQPSPPARRSPVSDHAAESERHPVTQADRDIFRELSDRLIKVRGDTGGDEDAGRRISPGHAAALDRRFGETDGDDGESQLTRVAIATTSPTPPSPPKRAKPGLWQPWETNQRDMYAGPADSEETLQEGQACEKEERERLAREKVLKAEMMVREAKVLLLSNVERKGMGHQSPISPVRAAMFEGLEVLLNNIKKGLSPH